MTSADPNPELANFLAHSLELEAEAQQRYGELAASMASHRNQPVAEFFRRMATEAEHHQQEVVELAAGMVLPQLKAWEFDWPGAEAPETSSYETLHYRMSLREAMALALANERAAEQYYRSFASDSDDPATVAAATRFADEERGHAAALGRLIAALPEQAVYHREEDDEPHMPE
ncbi:MAG: ferritin family protein [Halieaceae bacterium]|jgi:rubrerythrin|nr:ferritin family protein [Halieaceae bacterium]